MSPGRREIPLQAGITYSAFVDPSAGRRDALTLAIAHRADDRCRIDLVRAWKPPLNPAGVAAQMLVHFEPERGGCRPPVWPSSARMALEQTLELGGPIAARVGLGVQEVTRRVGPNRSQAIRDQMTSVSMRLVNTAAEPKSFA